MFIIPASRQIKFCIMKQKGCLIIGFKETFTKINIYRADSYIVTKI